MLTSAVAPGDVAALVRRRPFLFALRSSKKFIFATAAIGLFTSTFVHSILFPLAPFIVRRIKYGDTSDTLSEGDTSTSQETGILVAIYAAGLIVGSPIFGWLGDKVKQRRLPMLLGITLSVSANFLFMFSSVYWMLLTARLLQGVANACVWTMCLCLIADNWPLEELGLQMGKVVGFYPLGMICGLPAGVLYSKLGFQAPFAASLILCVCDFSMRLVMIERVNAPAEWFADQPKPKEMVPAEKEASTPVSKPTHVNGPHVTTWQLLRIPRLWASLILMTLVASTMSAFEPTLSMRMAEEWHFGPLQCGLILIAFVVPNIGSSVVAGHLCDKFGTKIVALASLVLVIPSNILMGVPDHRVSFWVLVPVLVFGGITLAGCQSAVFPEIAQIIENANAKSKDESEQQGKVMADRHGLARSYALANAAYAAGMCLGPLLAGFLYSTVGFFWVCCTIAGGFFLCIPIAIFFIGGSRRWIVRKVAPNQVVP